MTDNQVGAGAPSDWADERANELCSHEYAFDDPDILMYDISAALREAWLAGAHHQLALWEKTIELTDEIQQREEISHSTGDLAQAYYDGKLKGMEEQRQIDAEILKSNIRHDHTSGECPYCEMPKIYAERILSQSVQGAAFAPERDDTKDPK